MRTGLRYIPIASPSPEMLGAMREWLDRNDRPIVRVETERDDGGAITIKIQFEGNDLAEQFRQSFCGSYAG
jgi:hypothetical protein